MSIETIDARGLSCPEPIILTMRAVAGGIDRLDVLVDTDTSRENVLRFAENRGYTVSATEEGGSFRLSLSRP